MTKKEQLESAYKKERQRIIRQLNRLKKRGYLFERSEILPDKPKNIREGSIRRLQKITPEKIYKKTTFLDVSTGQFERGSAGRELEKEIKKEQRKEKQLQKVASRMAKEEMPITPLEPVKEPRPKPEPVKTPEPHIKPVDSIPQLSDQYMVYDFIVDNVIQAFYNRIKSFYLEDEKAELIIYDWAQNLISENGKEAFADMLLEISKNNAMIEAGDCYPIPKLLKRLAYMASFMRDTPGGSEALEQLQEQSEQDEFFDTDRFGDLIDL